MGSFQRFVSLETLYLGRGKCDGRPQMWQSIEDESAYMAQCSQVGNIRFSKSSQKGGCLERSGREHFLWTESMHTSLRVFGGLVGIEE